jgi:AraC family transcriptional regulator of adaptative response/methylated-DNA-[protein]-cysteine methyltransferase
MTQLPPFSPPGLFDDANTSIGHHPDLSILMEDTADLPVTTHERSITYGEAHTKFGPIFLAASDAGICRVSFGCSLASELEAIHIYFPDFHVAPGSHPTFDLFLSVLREDLPAGGRQIPVHLRGTAFQLSVWRALTAIPFGKRVSYAELARSIGRPDAVRAVGTAIGRNPVAWLIPCHRVVHTGGRIGHYMWGPERKRAILAWEAGVIRPVE